MGEKIVKNDIIIARQKSAERKNEETASTFPNGCGLLGRGRAIRFSKLLYDLCSRCLSSYFESKKAWKKYQI